MQRVAALVLVSLVCSWPSSAAGEPGFWTRVKMASQSHEVQTLQAVERVLSGRGEELDLLLVRAGLVELMRNRIKTPRTVVLLFHLRRQLGLSPPRGGVERLGRVLSGPLSSYDRALGHYELARLLLDEERSEALSSAQFDDRVRTGFRHLDAALLDAWEPRLRSEVALYRGLAFFRRQDFIHAEFDLHRVLLLGVSRRLDKSAYAGLALLHLARDDEARSAHFLHLSKEADKRSTRAAEVSLLSDFPLSEAETTIVESFFEATGAGGETIEWTFDFESCRALHSASHRVAPPLSVILQRMLDACATAGVMVHEVDPDQAKRKKRSPIEVE